MSSFNNASNRDLNSLAHRVSAFVKTLTPGEQKMFGELARAAYGPPLREVTGYNDPIDLGGIEDEHFWRRVFGDLSLPYIPPPPKITEQLPVAHRP